MSGHRVSAPRLPDHPALCPVAKVGSWRWLTTVRLGDDDPVFPKVRGGGLTSLPYDGRQTYTTTAMSTPLKQRLVAAGVDPSG